MTRKMLFLLALGAAGLAAGCESTGKTPAAQADQVASASEPLTAADKKAAATAERKAAKDTPKESAPKQAGEAANRVKPPGQAAEAAIAKAAVVHAAKAENPSSAYVWLNIALEVMAREHARVAPRPTVGARMMSIITTCMYDAWAAYDEKAVGTRLGGKLRRPAEEHTDENKTTAIGYACYRAMMNLYPEDAEFIREKVKAQGLDPDNDTTDTTTAAGIGNVAAAAQIAYRRHDGSNQYGNEPGSNGKPYSDYPYYRPMNTKDKCLDPDCWQPIEFDDAKNPGKKVVPGFLTPHWYRVKPFVLEKAEMFRPPPPPKVGSEQLKKEVDEVVKFNASLTPEQKAVVEFMRDGPKSTGQSGHWLRFAQDVSRRDKHNIDQDVKLFFSVANIVHDGFIACWECKRFYDSSRPWTLVRHYYKGQTISGWVGPHKGVSEIPAEKWHPYSPSVFITPPFPSYTSGHSTVSAAAAKILELYTGSDEFNAVEYRRAGAMTEPDLKPGEGEDAKLLDVALELPTFSATAEMAGISRVMGGYHIQADNVEGLKLGRTVAEYSWPKYQQFFDGTAPAPADGSADEVADAGKQ